MAIRPSACARTSTERTLRNKTVRAIAATLAARIASRSSAKVRPRWSRRGQVVRPIEINVIDGTARDERLDCECLVGFGNCLGDLIGLERDVFAAGCFVALDLVPVFHRLTSLGIDKFAVDAVAGLPVEDMDVTLSEVEAAV